jgi:hypothetical protein
MTFGPGLLGQEIFQRLDVFTYASLAFLFGIAAQFRAIGGQTLMRGIISAFESGVCHGDVLALWLERRGRPDSYACSDQAFQVIQH